MLLNREISLTRSKITWKLWHKRAGKAPTQGKAWVPGASAHVHVCLLRHTCWSARMLRKVKFLPGVMTDGPAAKYRVVRVCFDSSEVTMASLPKLIYSGMLFWLLITNSTKGIYNIATTYNTGIC